MNKIIKTDKRKNLNEHERAIFTHLLNVIIEKKSPEAPFVVGINGIDGSGKTSTASKFAGFLEDETQEVQLIHIDDFHNPKSLRYAEEAPEPEKYFHQSFNLQTVIDELLTPLRTEKQLQKTLKLLNLETDQFDLERTYSITPESIVIFEGVFLFRSDLLPFLDYRILVDIPFEESKKRAVLRAPHLTEDDLASYDRKYIPAQKQYFETCQPHKVADLVIDNTDFKIPRIKITSQSWN